MDGNFILEQISALSWIDWTSLITGVVYVYLAARNIPLCWVFGIISCGSIAYIDVFTGVALYSDALLQLFYILMGIYGLYLWILKNPDDTIVHSIQSKNWRWHVIAIVIISLISWPFAIIMKSTFGGAFPLIDAWTTVMSIWATFLLARRIMENWIYWIFLDIIYIGLYYLRDAPILSVLFIVYTGFAIYGYFKWKEIQKTLFRFNINNN